jgi:protein-arginine kinase activator protein McsA
MDNDFYKKFEKILDEIFGGKHKPTIPFESFLENLKYDDIDTDFSKLRNSVRKTKDGIITSIHFVINPNTKWSASNSNTKRDLETKLNECIQNQDFEQAAKIRDEIKELQKNKGKIETLKKEMEIAIEKQDFERAIEIRDELKKIN